MSKIKMLLDVVQDMRSLTDSLEALARAIVSHTIWRRIPS